MPLPPDFWDDTEQFAETEPRPEVDLEAWQKEREEEDRERRRREAKALGFGMLYGGGFRPTQMFMPPQAWADLQQWEGRNAPRDPGQGIVSVKPTGYHPRPITGQSSGIEPPFHNGPYIRNIKTRKNPGPRFEVDPKFVAGLLVPNVIHDSIIMEMPDIKSGCVACDIIRQRMEQGIKEIEDKMIAELLAGQNTHQGPVWNIPITAEASIDERVKQVLMGKKRHIDALMAGTDIHQGLANAVFGTPDQNGLVPYDFETDPLIGGSRIIDSCSNMTTTSSTPAPDLDFEKLNEMMDELKAQFENVKDKIPQSPFTTLPEHRPMPIKMEPHMTTVRQIREAQNLDELQEPPSNVFVIKARDTGSLGTPTRVLFDDGDKKSSGYTWPEPKGKKGRRW